MCFLPSDTTPQHDDLVRDPRTHLTGAPFVWLLSSSGRKPKKGTNKRNQHITSQDMLYECAGHLHSIKCDVTSIEHSPNSPTRRCSKRHQRFFKHHRPETIPHIKHMIVARRRCPYLQHSKVLQMASSVDQLVFLH